MKLTTSQFIARTGLLLALCVVIQLFMPAQIQIAKGPAVNVVLLMAAMGAGLYGGLLVAVINPILVFLIAPPAAMSACPAIVFVVILGNAIYVTCAWVLRDKWLGIPALALACFAKAGAMIVATSYIIIPFFAVGLPEKLVSAIKVSFGAAQFSTACIGAVVFFVIWRIVKTVPSVKNKVY